MTTPRIGRPATPGRTSGTTSNTAPPGLKGLVVADTTVGDVRGQEGFYHYRQYAAPDLARRRTFEDVWHLLAVGDLPDPDASARFAREVAARRSIPEGVLEALGPVARTASTPATALRTALSHHASVIELPATIDADPDERADQALGLGAAVPVLVAALHRLRHGHEPVPSRPDLGHVADYLWMLHGVEADPAVIRALEQYLILTIDHGFNASTFTGRVVTSTGADLGSAVVSALGALLGPLHGGAPSRALDTLDEIGDPAHARAWVRDRVARGERIMGFGHAVYRTADPRSELLREVGLRLGGPRVEAAVAIEREIEAELAALKPGRDLRANVEWYAAVVMDRCGLPPDLFTPTFAVSRVVGWCTHALEQAADGVLIRPSSRYVGTPPAQPVPGSWAEPAS